MKYYGVNCMVMVFLVQHGQARSKEEDPERHLTDRGREESELVAKYLSEKLDQKVHIIYHSGKSRARETAEIFARYLEPIEGLKEDPRLAPLEDPNAWVEIINNLDKNIMIVGHLPHLSKLTSILLIGDSDKEIVKFRYSGVLCLERGEKWFIKFYVVPDIL